jgi:hypothetical protein
MRNGKRDRYTLETEQKTVWLAPHNLELISHKATVLMGLPPLGTGTGLNLEAQSCHLLRTTGPLVAAMPNAIAEEFVLSRFCVHRETRCLPKRSEGAGAIREGNHVLLSIIAK